MASLWNFCVICKLVKASNIISEKDYTILIDNLMCSDGIIRVFSADTNRQADPALLQQFAEEVATASVAAEQELGGVKISEYVCHMLQTYGKKKII